MNHFYNSKIDPMPHDRHGFFIYSTAGIKVITDGHSFIEKNTDGKFYLSHFLEGRDYCLIGIIYGPGKRTQFYIAIK